MVSKYMAEETRQPKRGRMEGGKDEGDIMAEPAEENTGVQTYEREPDEAALEEELEEAKKAARVDAFRAGIRHKVKSVVGVLGAGAFAGWISGHAVQNAYRDATGYDPYGYEDADGSADEETPRKGWFKRRWQKAKNTLKEKAQPALAFGDTVAFWGPFLLAFLAFSYATSKLLAGYRKIFQPVPPEVEGYLDSVMRRQLRMRAEMEKLRAQFTGENPRLSSPADIQSRVAEVMRDADEMQEEIEALSVRIEVLESGHRRRS